jgi:hypothetical protein
VFCALYFPCETGLGGILIRQTILHFRDTYRTNGEGTGTTFLPRLVMSDENFLDPAESCRDIRYVASTE